MTTTTTTTAAMVRTKNPVPPIVPVVGDEPAMRDWAARQGEESGLITVASDKLGRWSALGIARWGNVNLGH